MPTKSFYKVVVLDIDVFETTIKDERHFGCETDAQDYANSSDGYAIVIKIQ